MIFKPKVEMPGGDSILHQTSPGITCSLYPALKAVPSSTEIQNFKAHLQQVNKRFGISLYMTAGDQKVPTKVGPAPLGGYLSYQLAPTEGNFKVVCNIDLSRQRNGNEIPRTIFPPLPISSVFPLFTFYESLRLSHNAAATLEAETKSQPSSSRWWSERRVRLTASTFGDILSRESISCAFLKGLVGDQNTSVNIRNLPDPLKHKHEGMSLEQYQNYLKHSAHPVKTFPSGFVVNPTYTFLGCSPDSKVIDETEDNPYGFVKVKCPFKHRNVTPGTACSGDSHFHLEMKDDFPTRKRNFKYYF